MMKRKYLFSAVIVLLLVCAFFGGYLVHSINLNSSVYKLDIANGCSWKNGHVNISSTVAGPIIKINVPNKYNAAFIAFAEQSGVCAYKE